jgi:co-chaperonin GroES (HSP10)
LQRLKKAGIDIPKQHKDREESIVDTGTVLEIGSDCWAEFKEPWCKVGDKVAYAKYAGKAIKQKDGSKLLVLNDEDVCAVLGETDE